MARNLRWRIVILATYDQFRIERAFQFLLHPNVCFMKEWKMESAIAEKLLCCHSWSITKCTNLISCVCIKLFLIGGRYWCKALWYWRGHSRSYGIIRSWTGWQNVSGCVPYYQKLTFLSKGFFTKIIKEKL